MRELIDVVTKIAPALGTALGGPLGGAITGVIAEVLGLDKNASPESILTTIHADPAVAQQQLEVLSKQIETETARWHGQSRNVELFYETYNRELDKGWFWSMPRPMAAWVTNLFVAMVCLILVRDLWYREYGLLNQVPMLITWIAIPAALAGIWFWQKTTERTEASASIKDLIVGKLRK